MSLLKEASRHAGIDQEILVARDSRDRSSLIQRLLPNNSISVTISEAAISAVLSFGCADIEPDWENRMAQSSLFLSYSHRDESFRDELAKHLKLLERQGILSTWHDRQIGAGEEWRHSIDEHLRDADIILLLISADFLASDYLLRCRSKNGPGET